MNVRDDHRERVVDNLSRHLLDTGLAQTSLRQLAAAAGVSDRMLLYYFSDKTEVLASVLHRVATELGARLAAAIPDGTRLPPGRLIVQAAAFTTAPDMRPFMRLWIEVVAAAARKEEPFATIAGHITTGFLQWIDARLDAPSAMDREAVAAVVLALVDGLALVEACSGAALSTRAVDALRALDLGS